MHMLEYIAFSLGEMKETISPTSAEEQSPLVAAPFAESGSNLSKFVCSGERVRRGEMGALPCK